MAGAVVAGKKNGGYDGFSQAVQAMAAVQDQKFTPNPDNVKTYNRFYKLYKHLHDAFGTKAADNNLYEVMKELLVIREEVKT